METIHTDLAGLHRGELDGCNEVWLAEPQQCLWRAVQVVSHEMMSEGTHEQNLRRVYVHTSPLGDAAEVERQVRQRIRERPQWRIPPADAALRQGRPGVLWKSRD